MTIFRNMTLGIRLSIGFGVVLASLCAVSVLGVAGMSRIGAMADRIIEEDWRRSQAAHRVADAARATYIVALQTLQKTEQTPFTLLLERDADARKVMDGAMGELVQLTDDHSLVASFHQAAMSSLEARLRLEPAQRKAIDSIVAAATCTASS